jgi:hypothetical protein
MGYIPQHSLDNLKKYSYKGVDKCVIQVVGRLLDREGRVLIVVVYALFQRCLGPYSRVMC